MQDMCFQIFRCVATHIHVSCSLFVCACLILYILGLMDEEMDRGVSLQDMLSHRTGMPRHDLSGVQRKGGVSEMVSRNAVVIYIYDLMSK